MKRLFHIVFLLFVCAFSLHAQTYDTIISNPDSFVFSESEGRSLSDADNLALAGLSEQIVVHVSSAIHNERTNETKNFNSLVQTYSNTTLPNCRRIILENGPRKYRVVRYIETSELRKVFKNRENKVLSMVDVAQKAERELKLDQALKYYYWALCLTESLVYPSSLKCFDADGAEQVVQVWLPLKIQNILDDVDVAFDGFLDEEKTDGRLKISFRGSPVSSLDYYYFDGVSWSTLNSGRDGLGVIELRANSEISRINFKIEYTYDCESHIDNEVRQVLSLLDGRTFKEAFKNVSLEKCATPVLRQQNNEVTSDNLSTEMSAEYSIQKAELSKVIGAIRQKDYSSVSELFTPEGYEQFSRLIAYGKAKVLSDPIFKSIKIGEETYFRSVPMQFSFDNNQKTFIENVVFSINETGKIDGLNFALEQNTIDDILKKSKWDDYRKSVLINFLENYQTAFALKRIDYISSIFSEDALIIVGQVVKPVALENQITGSEQVIYHRYTKEEYLKKVRLSFDSKEYINLKFANLDIYKMGKGDNIFCIQIKQDYCSSNYGDSGYLCLLLDLGDPQKPIIHVRTWQPKPDEEFGIFGPGDF